MKCENAAPVMDAYLDGELELTTCVAVEEHLASCEGCRKRLAEREELVRAIREEVPRHAASPFLATRIRASLKAERAEQEPWWRLFARGRWMAGGLGGALALLAVALFLSGNGFDRQLGEEAIASHVRSLQANHLMDVVSTDRHTVKPWFAGRVDFAPPVVDLQQAGFPLVGGRLDFLDHHEVAALVYQRRKHYINLFIWPAREGITKESSYQADGYRVYGWTAGGMNFLAVSELGAAEMREFSEKIKAGGGAVRE